MRKFFISRVKTPIFGVAVNAFNRLGPEDFVPQYRLLALYDSQDTRLIEKDIPVFSLEREVGRQIRWQVKRNSTSVITHPQTRKYLADYSHPLLLPYKASNSMFTACRKNNWLLAANPPSFGKGLLDNKVKFRRILQKIGVPTPPGEIAAFGNLSFDYLARKYGLPFVVQYPLSGGGKGTFFIRSKHDLVTMRQSLIALAKGRIDGYQELVISRFIKGPSPSVTGCATRWGIFATAPQYQILSMPELYNRSQGAGLFCGHDWSSSHFSEAVRRQIGEAVEKTGRYLYGIGYRGIFGLDFIMDEKTKRVYTVECNPRLLGSLPTLTMAQVRNGEPPILAFHILEFLDAEVSVDVRAVNALMGKEKLGAQMFLHNLSDREMRIRGSVKPGVYQLEKQRLSYLRPGYKLSHLQDEKEFIISDGVLLQGRPIGAHRRLARLLTLAPVLAEYQSLNPWAKRIIQAVYREFDLQPIRFWRLRHIFNFLLKGERRFLI